MIDRTLFQIGGTLITERDVRNSVFALALSAWVSEREAVRDHVPGEAVAKAAMIAGVGEFVPLGALIGGLGFEHDWEERCLRPLNPEAQERHRLIVEAAERIHEVDRLFDRLEGRSVADVVGG